MSRRTVAGLLALGLIAILLIFGATQPVDYVTRRPGPTVNVLGQFEGKQIVDIKGHRSYRDDGALRMVTVIASGPEDRISLVEVIAAWVDPDSSVLPRENVYPENESEEQIRQESAAQMTSSKDAATAAALRVLGIDYRADVSFRIAEVIKGGASHGKLRTGDHLIAVDGRRAETTDGLVGLIRDVKPGTALALTILRNGSRKQITVTTEADEKVPKRSRIGVTLSQPELRPIFPFKVTISLSDRIGGPSAGMMFALTIYDLLTPGSLTGGKVIAGTGEITPDGIVLPIGGIAQKIAGAQADGARLFLVPEENCSEAAGAHYDEDKIRLVKVHTLSEAIEDVDSWRENPDAALPRCAR